MDLVKDVLRQYWLHIVALVIFAIAAVRFWQLPDRFGHLRLFLLALGGVVAVIASDEFAEYTGRYGWTRSQFRIQPTWFVRLIGCLFLLWATVRLFRL